ncbi:MAG: leucine-rich repeat protein [Rikenellaceae bacterium]
MKKLTSILMLLTAIVITSCESGDDPTYLNVSSIEISGEPTLTISVGEQKQLSVSFAPSEDVDLEVIWSVVEQSSDNVITLSADGLITANKVGSATISATLEQDELIFTTCDVNVIYTLSNYSQTMALAEFSAEKYPYYDSEWIISDTTASASDYAGLREALTMVTMVYGDEISLKFPNLTSFAAGALCSNVSLDELTESEIECSDSEFVLASLSAPNVVSVGKCAFTNSQITTINLPSVETIKSYAFMNCQIESINISNVIDIEESALSLNNFSEISLDYLMTLGDYALAYQSLESLSLPICVNIGDYAIYKNESLRSLSTPSAVTIGNYAFAMCNMLTEISLPNAVTVGKFAFSNCSSATSISISRAQNIGVAVLFGCYELNTLSVNSNYYKVENKVLYNADMTSIHSSFLNNFDGSSSTTFFAPSTVKEVGSYAFYGDGTSKIYFTNVETIGSYAFYCAHIESIYSGSKVNSIGNYAFEYCTQLGSASFSSAATIGNGAFSNCWELSSVSIPSAEVIGESVFESTDALEELTIATQSILTKIGEFGGTAENIDLTIGQTGYFNATTKSLTIGDVTWGPFRSYVIE